MLPLFTKDENSLVIFGKRVGHVLRQRNIQRSRFGFTLIELLIVIGIVAILSSAVIVVLNPANLINQSRDAQRVSDLVSINDALKFYELDGGTSFGTSTKVYISLPDNNGDGLCNEYSLPTSSRTYACAASSTYTAVNGTGWIPVNFTSVGTLSFSSLPIDPVNTDSGNYYYSYLPGGSWKLTATMESSGGKFDTLAANDGGTESGEFEIGTDLSLTHATSTPSASAPSQITDLAATAGDGQVSLSWTAPSNGGSAILYYNIYRGLTSGGESLTASTTNTSYTDTGRTNGVTYYYQVAAVNAVGTATLSNEASATPYASGGLVWAATSTSATSVAYGIAVDSSAVYVAGYDVVPGNDEWRMESRSLSTGAANWSTSTNPTTGSDTAWAVDTDGTSLYFAGYDANSATEWRIEKRSASTGALTWATTSAPAGTDTAYDIDEVSGSIYVAGSQSTSGDYRWRIEKRSASTGALTWAVTSDPCACTAMEEAYAIASDGTSVFVAGYQYPGTYHEWRVEGRNATSGALEWSTSTAVTGGGHTEAQGITQADDGNIYIVGGEYDGIAYRWKMEKRDNSTGSLIWSTSSNPSALRDDIAYDVTTDDNYVYVVGSDATLSATDGRWRIEKRSVTDGSLVWATTTNPSSGYEQPYDIADDTNYLYIAGYDSSGGTYRIRVEKRYK